MNKLLLKLVMLLTPLWRNLGADIVQLEAILKMRLLMDDRKPIGMGRTSNAKKEKKQLRNGSLLSAFLYFVFGIIYMGPIVGYTDRIYGLTIHFTVLFVLLTMTLVSDFSNTLFDNRDKMIIAPRPIDDRTILLSKMLHIFIYLVRMIIPMTLPTVIALAFIDKWYSPVFYYIPLVLLIFMTLFFVNVIYLLILNIASGSKFKDILSFFQILSSIFLFGLIYLRQNMMFGADGNQTIDYQSLKWVKFIPTYWFASMWQWLGVPNFFHTPFFISLLGLIVPIILMTIFIKVLAPRFSARISEIDINESSQSVPVAKVKSNSKTGKRLYERLADVFCKDDESKAGFMLTWIQTSRSRTFRLRVYPSLATTPIYFISIIMARVNKAGSTQEVIERLSHSRLVCIFLYLSATALISALNFIVLSESYKASWVYYATPINTPGKVMDGAVKAIIAKIFIPVYLVIGIVFASAFGISYLSNIVLAFLNILFFGYLIMYMGFRKFPFSQQEATRQKSGRFLRNLMGMFATLLMGALHMLAFHILWFKLILIVLVGILVWMMQDSYAKTPWDVIKYEDN